MPVVGSRRQGVFDADGWNLAAEGVARVDMRVQKGQAECSVLDTERGIMGDDERGKEVGRGGGAEQSGPRAGASDLSWGLKLVSKSPPNRLSWSSLLDHPSLVLLRAYPRPLRTADKQRTNSIFPPLSVDATQTGIPLGLPPTIRVEKGAASENGHFSLKLNGVTDHWVHFSEGVVRCRKSFD
ncbi:unnamed protein product [Pleuronectes platessa]|uniref:Uncharacterized protein n=1 Tax=Pleuronectes platessa TaxID=8262 RepID=A0A9N7UY27_PLEPL|nr:unnamed protein product [Pleuronectes platessa]